jgi:hypothetical protein
MEHIKHDEEIAQGSIMNTLLELEGQDEEEPCDLSNTVNNNSNTKPKAYFEIKVDLREGSCIFDTVAQQCVHDVEVKEEENSKPIHLGTMEAKRIVKLMKYHSKENEISPHFRKYM